ncbi:unnamed protein product [Closterium sp. NIES-54]
MIHARAPHFLWPYTVRYAAHQLNLWPHVSWPEASPTSLWTGSLGIASEFCIWGCLALVHNTSLDKLSARAISCIFFGFPVAAPDFVFYHPPLHRFLDSRDVRFDEYVPVPSGVSHATPLPSVARQVSSLLPQSSSQPQQQPSALPRHAAKDSGGVGAGGARSGGARSGVAGARGAGTGGASSGEYSEKTP